MNVTTIGQDSGDIGERRRIQARARRLAKRAQFLAVAGRVDEAIACQSEVAALRPHDPVAFFRLGLLYREARRIEPAVLALRQAADLSPSERDTREALIATLVEANRFQEVIGEAKALLRVVPRSVFARDVLCMAFYQVGDLEKALRVLGELIFIDPRNPDHYLKRAMLLHRQENIKGAVGEYSRVMDMASPDSEAYACAADSLESLDDDQLRQILQLAGDDQLFRWKIDRDAVEATQERGYFLSPEGLYRLSQISQQRNSIEVAPDEPRTSPIYTYN